MKGAMKEAAMWKRTLFLSFLLVNTGAFAADTPATRPVLSILKAACDWQLAHLSTAHLSNDHGNNAWIRAPFFLGDLALYRRTGDDRYLTPILDIAKQNQWQPGKRPRHADDQAVGQVYLELYFLNHDPAEIAPIKDRWDAIMAQPMKGRDDWWWCDALFMAPPALARLATATGDHKYIDYLNGQYWDTTDFLYDPAEHLFFRDKSYFQTREANGQKIFWSRGNGWVLAGLASVLQYLPADDASRPRFVKLFTEISERVITLQQPDGFWRTSLLDPASCPGGEASGTGFFCYALAWGVNNGILPRDKYQPVVEKAWGALSGAVDGDGKLHWVQLPGAKPAKINSDDTAEYGVGALLLAGDQVLKLSEGTK